MLEAGNTRFLVAGAVFSPHGPRFLFIKRRGGGTRLPASSKCAKTCKVFVLTLPYMSHFV